MQCPGADDQVGCFEMSEGNQAKFYGNEVHNAGINPTSSKFYHAVYFSTDSNHVDVGWNHIHDNFTCRALQFHSSPLCTPSCGAADTTGFNQFDLHVHDNLIHGDNCNGINFATVDPSKGPVEAYNNVIYNVGRMDPLQAGRGIFLHLRCRHHEQRRGGNRHRGGISTTRFPIARPTIQPMPAAHAELLAWAAARQH